ncbi:MAG: hypothetical protein QM658_07575 [Gordonia sp. (in: high G+C Gram-positive bacteria)]
MASGSRPGELAWPTDHLWALAVLVFLAVRTIGLFVLALFGGIHEQPMRELLTKWDGQWMLELAEHGYSGASSTLTDAQGLYTPDTGYAFFPGYPMLVGALAKIPGVSPFGAATTISLVAGCVAAVGVARLGALCARRSPYDVDPQSVGLILVVLFAATPMSIVLNMAYTEALFCALAAWALVGVLSRQWLLAGFCALGVGLVRPTGVAVIAVVMVAALLARRDGPRAWAAVVLAPLGYLGYLAVVAVQTGSPTGWFRIQTDGWDTRFDFGSSTARFVWNSLTSAEDFASVATSFVILVTLGLLVWAFAASLPWPVTAYATLVLASVLLSGGLMMSRARLVLPAFVLLIPLAILLSRGRPAVRAWLVLPVLGSAWFGAYMLTVFQYAI